MGMSTYVIGFIPPDEKFKEMKKVFDVCKSAGIEPPSEVWGFFNDETPKELGVEIDIDSYVTEVSPHASANGWEIDLERLGKEKPNIKKIQFINSY